MKGNKELIQRWIDKADRDLSTAKLIYLHLPDYYEMIAFHCQQSVEKYLKALLLFYDIEFERSHNLIYLLDLLSQKKQMDIEKYDKAILLNGFSIQIRYPDQTIVLTKEEIEASIQIADYFRDFVIVIIE